MLTPFFAYFVERRKTKSEESDLLKLPMALALASTELDPRRDWYLKPLRSQYFVKIYRDFSI